MDDDLADLIGPTDKPTSARERRLRDLAELTRRNRVEQGDETSFDLADIHAGVSVGWLSKVFGMDPTTVKKRLADCPPLHRRKAGYVYSLPQAAGYLVKPVFDATEYIKSMKPSELPSQLQKEYWDAALKRQKWELNAGQLWRTESVREVFAETFKSMKFSIQLWADSIERQTGLTDEQRKIIETLSDTLQADLYEALVTQAAKRETRPTLAEVGELTGEGESDDDLI